MSSTVPLNVLELIIQTSPLLLSFSDHHLMLQTSLLSSLIAASSEIDFLQYLSSDKMKHKAFKHWQKFSYYIRSLNFAGILLRLKSKTSNDLHVYKMLLSESNNLITKGPFNNTFSLFLSPWFNLSLNIYIHLPLTSW